MILKIQEKGTAIFSVIFPLKFATGLFYEAQTGVEISDEL